MSTAVRTPRLSANEDLATLVAWLVDDGSPVVAGQPIAELETSKSAVEIVAPCGGFLVHAAVARTPLEIGEVLASITDTAPTAGEPAGAPPPSRPAPQIRATPGARRLADATGVDLAALPPRTVLRERDVVEALKVGSIPTARASRARPGAPTPVDAEALEVFEPPAPPATNAMFSARFLRRLLSRGRTAADLPPLLRVGVLAARGAGAIARVVVSAAARVPVVGSLTDMLVRAWPRGLTGLILRAAYLRTQVAALGTDTMVDPFVEVWGGRQIHIGHGCHLDRHVSLAADPRPDATQRLEIGPHVHLGPYVQLFGQGGIRIGALSALGAGTKVYSIANVIDDPDDPRRLLSPSHAAPPECQRQSRAAVEVGDHAFVGLNVCVLPGVRIGRGAFIASGTVVARDVPAFAIFGGAPARVLGSRSSRPTRGAPSAPDNPAPAVSENPRTADP